MCFKTVASYLPAVLPTASLTSFYSRTKFVRAYLDVRRRRSSCKSVSKLESPPLLLGARLCSIAPLTYYRLPYKLLQPSLLTTSFSRCCSLSAADESDKGCHIILRATLNAMRATNRHFAPAIPDIPSSVFQKRQPPVLLCYNSHDFESNASYPEDHHLSYVQKDPRSAMSRGFGPSPLKCGFYRIAFPVQPAPSRTNTLHLPRVIRRPNAQSSHAGIGLLPCLIASGSQCRLSSAFLFP